MQTQDSSEGQTHNERRGAASTGATPASGQSPLSQSSLPKTSRGSKSVVLGRTVCPSDGRVKGWGRSEPGSEVTNYAG